MRPLLLATFLLVPAIARADVAPEPFSAIASAPAGIVLALAALIGGIWVWRRKRR
jgi:uncharacterized protein (TIGR03382 family)